jgi:hypothetical protein
VHEFRCLYTSDVQRKHKRWRDGLLRYHAFNARVVVYDAGSSYVGDGHWPRGVPPPLGEEVEWRGLGGGDEVLLQLMNGVLVQVEEARGSSVTDLTPLFERRGRASAESRREADAHGPPGRKAAPPPKDRSLRAILDARSMTSGVAAPLRPAAPQSGPAFERTRNPQQWRVPQAAPTVEQLDDKGDGGPARKRARRDPPEAIPRLDDEDGDAAECSAPPPLISSIEMLPTPTRRGHAKPAAMAPPKIAQRPPLAPLHRPPGRTRLNLNPPEASPPRRPEPATSDPPAPVPRAPRRVGISHASLVSKPWKPPQPRSDPPSSSPPVAAPTVFRNVEDYDAPALGAVRAREMANARGITDPRGPDSKAKPLRLAACKPKPKLLCLQAERSWEAPEPDPDPAEISDSFSSSSSAFTDL